MTYTEELQMLETYYRGWIEAGMPQSYSINGKSFSRPAMEAITRRLDQLRIAVSREQGSAGAAVVQFRGLK